MKPIPSDVWALICRRADEFEAGALSGSIVIELHYDQGHQASHKVNTVIAGRTAREKGLTGGRKRA